jgi:hypothetical protein
MVGVGMFKEQLMSSLLPSAVSYFKIVFSVLTGFSVNFTVKKQAVGIHTWENEWSPLPFDKIEDLSWSEEVEKTKSGQLEKEGQNLAKSKSGRVGTDPGIVSSCLAVFHHVLTNLLHHLVSQFSALSCMNTSLVLI